MSEAKFQKLIEFLRPFLVGNNQVPDDYSGQVATNLSQGAVCDVWANGKLKKERDMHSTTG